MEKSGRKEDRAGNEHGAVILAEPVSEETEESNAEQNQADGSGDEGKVFHLDGWGLRRGIFEHMR
jgi:hypothetical protein